MGPVVARQERDLIADVETAIAAGETRSLYLVAGERVLAEPGALRVAESLAQVAQCQVEVYTRPVSIASILADLKTYSLFSTAKVVVAVETALLADEGTAAELIDEVLEVLPLASAEPEALSDKERRAAGLLLHTLRLFRVDPFADSSAAAIERLPASACEGGKSSGRKRKRDKRQVTSVREKLTSLLDVARLTDLEGRAQTELGELAEIVDRGLPEGHALVLAESAVSANHPLVAALDEGGALVSLGYLRTSKKGDWIGLDRLATQLERETGVAISPRALEELARRTLQASRSRAREGSSAAQADSTGRLAAEYRKLAALAGSDGIELELVETTTEDRGDEDVWKTLDAIGAGRSEEAIARIHRLLASSEDPISERLSFFSLLAALCRQLTALATAIEQAGVERRPTSYARFKDHIAPRLQAELVTGDASPLSGLHPFRLYRAYSVACRLPTAALMNLPQRVLETEIRLKGDTDLPDAALTALVCDLTTAVRRAG